MIGVAVEARARQLVRHFNEWRVSLPSELFTSTANPVPSLCRNMPVVYGEIIILARRRFAPTLLRPSSNWNRGCIGIELPVGILILIGASQKTTPPRFRGTVSFGPHGPGTRYSCIKLGGGKSFAHKGKNLLCFLRGGLEI